MMKFFIHPQPRTVQKKFVNVIWLAFQFYQELLVFYHFQIKFFIHDVKIVSIARLDNL